jgi:aspartate/methionine/tyrosine aminotransferase
MIKPANRTNLVQEYYFSQKLKEIEQMNNNGTKVINLGIGNPDMSPPAKVVSTLIDEVNNNENHGYQSYKGIPELRAAFANWYSKFYNVVLNPETEILPLIGSKEGIMHISMAFLNQGDKVLVPNPGYPTYSSVSKIVGAEIINYNLLPQNTWYPDFDELEKYDLSNVKIMWVNYPNMPTGQQASFSIFKKLIAFGKKHNILICNDNPYSFILNDNPLSIMSVDGAEDIAIELNSLSKSHNMAGFRVGVVTANTDYISYILKIKSNMDSGMYKPVQLAAVKALESSQSWFNGINREYKKRRKTVWQLFDNLNTVYNKNQTGMFVWARIPDSYSNAFEFSDKVLHESKVFITPGSIFGSNGNRYVRISLCSTQKTINEAINRILSEKI